MARVITRGGYLFAALCYLCLSAAIQLLDVGRELWPCTNLCKEMHVRPNVR